MLIDWVLEDQKVELSPDDIWRCLGPAGGARAGLEAEVAEAALEAARLSAPRAAARSLGVVDKARAAVRFEGGVEITGRMLPHLFEGAQGGVFLLATAGPGIEGRVTELFGEGDAVRAIVLDAAGSAAAMSVFSELVERVNTALHGAGLRAGPCARPGTDAWPIEGQRALFSALPAVRTGVELLDSLLMRPQKSQSGVVPFGRELRVVHDPGASPCRSCTARRCPMRVEQYAGPVGR